MTKATFFYIALFALLFPLFSSQLEYSTHWQSLFCLAAIFVLGIPHGAADNVLFQARTKVSPPVFIGIYLLTIGLNALLWFLLPQMAYLVFILISGYHFGQSQFSHYFNREEMTVKILYLFWGLLLLGGMIFINRTEIIGYTQSYPDLAQFAVFSGAEFLQWFLAITGTGTLIVQVFLCYQKKWKWESFLLETVILATLILSFYVFPFLVSFTLYFVVLHSYKVMREQFHFLRYKKIIAYCKNYVAMILPFSLLSYLGIASILYAVNIELLPVSFPYVFLILISSITVPHVYVMEQFYKSNRNVEQQP